MRVRGVVKVICKHCYAVKRGKRRYVYCSMYPKHKQRQGFHTMSESTMEQSSPLEYGHICFGCNHSLTQRRNIFVQSPLSNETVEVSSSLANATENSVSTQIYPSMMIFRPTIGISPLVFSSLNRPNM